MSSYLITVQVPVMNLTGEEEADLLYDTLMFIEEYGLWDEATAVEIKKIS